MLRVVVVGCHGLIGQKLVELLGPDYCELHGVDIQPASYFPGKIRYSYHRHDVTQRRGLFDVIDEIQPRVIIHAAEMNSADICEIERERCWQVNVRGVENVVAAARRVASKVILLSSHDVFDGEAGPYSELAHPRPISYYGRSKHAAENVVLGGGVDGVVVRSVMQVGLARKLRPRFVPWLVGRLREGSKVRIVTDQISNVTLVDDVARALKRILSLNRKGLYHVAGREVLSRYEFALRIAEAYSMDGELIEPTLTRLLEQTAPRPLQGGLVVDKAQKELNMVFANVDEILRAYREQEAQLN